MAGVTNAAYRQLCREQHEAGGGTDGLFVCEMITSRGIVAGDRKTMEMLQFDPGETTRSVQLYGVDPATMADATAILAERFRVDHVDLNFGCPVPKVTRKGGGAALPYKRDRLRAILRAVVAAARPYGVPVTMKTRVGIDDAHQTYLDAGTHRRGGGLRLHRAARAHGAAVLLRARRLVDHRQAQGARLHPGARQRRRLGGRRRAPDARPDRRGRRRRRPRLPGPAVAVPRPGRRAAGGRFRGGRPRRALPTSGQVAVTIRRHAELLAALQTDPEQGERRALTDLRKHMAWYLKGYPVGGDTRRALAMVSSFAELDAALATLDPDLAFPVTELGTPRGRQGAPKAKVALPEHWLDDTSRGHPRPRRRRPRLGWLSPLPAPSSGRARCTATAAPVRTASCGRTRPRTRRVGPGRTVDRLAREAYEREVLRAGATFAEGAGDRAAARGARRGADLLRAGPGPDRALDGVPPAGRQDPGRRAPDRPPADPADARARGRPGRDVDRPRDRGERVAGRGDRPRPRLRPRPGRARERGRVRRRTCPAASTTARGAPTSPWPT